MTNYVATTIDRLAELLPGCDPDLLRLYLLLALVKGAHVTNRDVHDAWSAWCHTTRPDHRSLIPFDELTPEAQALDTKYAEAIRAVAA
jgi:hypothetical protein